MLQEGVTFHNGEPFTADDVIYSFERLRAKESPMAGVYANIKDVVADSPTQVTFKLKAVDSEFPSSLTDYRAKMLCKSVADPMKELVGTGPFMLKSFAAEDRAVLVKYPQYWQKAANGDQLPYFDEVDFIYSPDTAGQIEGLQGGALDWVGGITSEQKQVVESDPTLKTITSATNYLRLPADPRRPGRRQGPQVPPGAVGRHRPPGHHRPRGSRRGRAGQRHLRRPGLQGVLRRHAGRSRTTRRTPRSCSPRRGIPTASTSSWWRRPPTRSRPSPPPGRRR